MNAAPRNMSAASAQLQPVGPRVMFVDGRVNHLNCRRQILGSWLFSFLQSRVNVMRYRRTDSAAEPMGPSAEPSRRRRISISYGAKDANKYSSGFLSAFILHLRRACLAANAQIQNGTVCGNTVPEPSGFSVSVSIASRKFQAARAHADSSCTARTEIRRDFAAGRSCDSVRSTRRGHKTVPPLPMRNMRRHLNRRHAIWPCPKKMFAESPSRQRTPSLASASEKSAVSCASAAGARQNKFPGKPDDFFDAVRNPWR